MEQMRERETMDQAYRRIVGPLPTWWVAVREDASLEQPSVLEPLPSELTSGTKAPGLPQGQHARMG